MPLENSDVAKILDEVADLLEISGESYFRVRAYRNASRVIRDLTTPLRKIADDPSSRLEDLPGIGKDLASKIIEILDTGDLSLRRELEERIPTGLLEVMKVPGVGPRKAHALYLELGVSDLESLAEAAKTRRIRALKGFGEKTETNILEGVLTVKGFGNRILWCEAEPTATAVVNHMRGLKGLHRIEVAGSFRRLKETVGDLDVLVSCDDPQSAMDRFARFPGVKKIIAKGDTKSSILTASGLQIDLRAVDDISFGAALLYFTGSQAHGIALRSLAIKKGLKLNEYGVFRAGKRIAGKEEEEVYETLGLPFIPPELRENRGEISAALDGRLPRLIELEDIRGDLHIHTNDTDGRDDLAAIVRAARDKKYSYVAITNHTKRVSMASGLDGEALLEHWRRIEQFDSRTQGIKILKGVEVDILDDGSLDIPDEILSQADFVIAAVHYNTSMTKHSMTRRVVKAVENPFVDAFAHPTGRLINRRPPYQIDMEELVAAAARNGKFLELNAAPDRLDLTDSACREAKRHGVKIIIATDAHSVGALDYMRFGIHQARRGWIEREDVANALLFRSLNKALRNRRSRAVK